MKASSFQRFLFHLGPEVDCSYKALKKLQPGEIVDICSRHTSGDWGNINNETAIANGEALTMAGTIKSRYEIRDDVTVCVTTYLSHHRTIIMLSTEKLKGPDAFIF